VEDVARQSVAHGMDTLSQSSYCKPPRALLPAASKRLVELDDTIELAQPDSRKIQLGLEQIPIGVQRIEERVHAAAIAHVGKVLSILQSGYQQLLLYAALANSLMRDERIRDLEDQVMSLVAQVNKAIAEKEAMWERLRNAA